MSDATYKIRPLKWQKSFGKYCQRYSAETEPWSFVIERWRREKDGQFGPWKFSAEYDDRGDPIYVEVKSASDGKKRCDEIYRQRLETMLVWVQEEDKTCRARARKPATHAHDRGAQDTAMSQKQRTSPTDR